MDIQKIVYDYASYDEGLTDSDIKNLIDNELPMITIDDYNKVGSVNTCIVIDDNIINYHWDVIRTLNIALHAIQGN